MRIGIFGGSFDPPHIGHLILAAECRYQLGLDRVLWVVTPIPPHKPGRKLTPVELRFEMVTAAIGDDPTFEASRVEMERSAPYFTADTLEILRERYPRAELILLMGGDSLRDLPTWHDPQRLVRVCDGIGVMRRLGAELDVDALDAKLPGLRGKLTIVEAPLLEISSSQIRGRIREGKPFRYYVPTGVYDQILRQELYQGEEVLN